MFVIDITRTNDELDNDMLVGKDSMDAKLKLMNYISDFVFANYNLSIDKDLLDRDIGFDNFSLKEFMKYNYSMDIDKDLISNFIHTNKDNCIFVKFFNENIDNHPTIYVLGKDQKTTAKAFFQYIINDEMIREFPDDDINITNDKSFNYRGIKANIISLYNGGLFMEELLNNTCSLKQLEKENIRGIDI